MLDIELAWRHSRGRACPVSRSDVVPTCRVVCCCDLGYFDFEIRIGARAGGDACEIQGCKRAGPLVDVRICAVEDEVCSDIRGCDVGTNTRPDREILRTRGWTVAVESDDVPRQWRDGERCLRRARTNESE